MLGCFGLRSARAAAGAVPTGAVLVAAVVAVVAVVAVAPAAAGATSPSAGAASPSPAASAPPASAPAIARRALQMPAFLRYDRVITAKFPVSARKSVTLYNQNSLLTSYRGAVGGKIGWTTAAGATYVGMARRNGVTLIVTLLHCPALTEIDAAKSLLNWGFAVDGKVRPAGTLVGPQQPPAPAPAPPAADHAAAARPPSAAPGPSMLATAGFCGVALLVAGLGFAHSRRQRPSPRSPG